MYKEYNNMIIKVIVKKCEKLHSSLMYKMVNLKCLLIIYKRKCINS